MTWIKTIPFSEARGKLLEAVCQVVAALVAKLGHALEALRPHAAKVGSRGNGHEGFVGADIRGSFFATDVLLAGLEGQHEATAALGVFGHAGQATRHLADVLFFGGEEAAVRPTERHRNAEALALAYGDICVKLAGGL